MRIPTTRQQATEILAAMADVAADDDGLGAAGHVALVAAAHWIFDIESGFRVDDLPLTGPARLATALCDPALRGEAIRFLTVMAFLDVAIDPGRIDRVLTYAAALEIHTASIDEIAAVARGRLDEALVHMVRDNMSSVTGEIWSGRKDVAAWMLPYRGGGADPELAGRYRALAALPPDRFGRAFHDHFQRNGYALPGEPEALNERFATPHDSSHVLAGYDTSPRGEILVSTFTAAMHPVHPISGHVLPVLFSWHLGIRINDVARSARGALDPAAFWHAWARGEGMRVDLFDPAWDFWSWVEQPLAQLRTAWLADPPHQSTS